MDFLVAPALELSLVPPSWLHKSLVFGWAAHCNVSARAPLCTLSSAPFFPAFQVTYIISICALPSEFTGIFSEEPERVVKNW